LAADSIDVSTGESMKMAELRLRDREKYLISKISKTLKRIEEGTFGFCLSCEEQIGYARLSARPVAELCIDCKEEQERQERQLRDEREEQESSQFFF
jgi:DnaK suppressor protein